VSTMETIKTARGRATVSTPGHQGLATKASISMTRQRGKGHTSILMAVSMKGTIRMIRDTVSDFTHFPLELEGEENGNREKGSGGLIEMYFLIKSYI
jgi:hypothetical protein